MHSPAFCNLYGAVEFVLTLSVILIQVNCNRAFSKLKIIKNCLRSSLEASIDYNNNRNNSDINY